eukprot:7981653-Pyramimonas_sp.AAC.1
MRYHCVSIVLPLCCQRVSIVLPLCYRCVTVVLPLCYQCVTYRTVGRGAVEKEQHGEVEEDYKQLEYQLEQLPPARRANQSGVRMTHVPAVRTNQAWGRRTCSSQQSR